MGGWKKILEEGWLEIHRYRNEGDIGGLEKKSWRRRGWKSLLENALVKEYDKSITIKIWNRTI